MTFDVLKHQVHENVEPVSAPAHLAEGSTASSGSAMAQDTSPGKMAAISGSNSGCAIGIIIYH